MALDELKRKLFELLGDSIAADGAMGVLYGSRRPGADVDFFILQPRPPVSPTIVVGDLDLLRFGRKDFEYLASRLDPLVIEPVLSGELVFGDEIKWSSIRQRISQSTADEPCVAHACRRCFEEYLAAERVCLEWENDDSPEVCRWVIQNLSFSISYASFARYYAETGARPCRLEDLISTGKVVLPEFWMFRDHAKHGRELNLDAAKSWLRRWGRTLINAPA